MPATALNIAPTRYMMRALFSLLCIAALVPSQIEAAPQHPEKASQAERHSFSWSAANPLRWTNFQGPIPETADSSIAAQTVCGIFISTNSVTENEPVTVTVTNGFDTLRSWCRRGHISPAVLQHEQGHWDICEIYTRQLRSRFASKQILGSSLNSEVPRIYQEVLAEYHARQQAYEKETAHGLDTMAQQRWNKQIAAELSTTSR